MTYSMKDVCRETGLTYDALKFYCNQGLIPNVKRNKNNYRIFDDNNLAWIKSLDCLKNCGMSIGEMKTYLELCLDGKDTISDRKITLSNKKDDLLAKIAELHKAVDYIDWKQGFYDDILSGKTEYFSNLIRTEK